MLNTNVENRNPLHIFVYEEKNTVSKSCWARFHSHSCLCHCSFLPQFFCSHQWNHLQSERIAETALLFRGVSGELVEKKEMSFVVEIIVSGSNFDLTLCCIAKSLKVINVITFMQNRNRPHNPKI